MRVDPWAALRDIDGFLSGVQALPVADSKAAVEFTYEGEECQFWFALPVSVGNRLDADLLREALTIFCEA